MAQSRKTRDSQLKQRGKGRDIAVGDFSFSFSFSFSWGPFGGERERAKFVTAGLFVVLTFESGSEDYS